MTDNRHLAWIVPIILIAAWLGVIGLNEGMLWYDEWWSYWSAGGGHYGPLPLDDILERAINEPSQPPTFYVMLAGWGGVAGWSAFGVRFMTFIMGILALAWTYRLGTDVSGKRAVGLLAALLLGTSALFTDYLHELRLYSMMILFSTMTLSLYWRAIHRDDRWTLALLTVGAAGVMYSHYLAALVLPAIGIYHLLMVQKNRRWWEVTATMTLGVAVFLPWVVYVLDALDRMGAGRTDTAFPTPELMVHLVYAISNGTWILIAALGLVLPRRQSRSDRFLWIVAVMIVVQAIILNEIIAIVTHVRYMLALWSVLAVMLAVGLYRYRWRQVRPVFAGVIVLWVGAGIVNSLTPGFSNYLFREIHMDFFRPNLPLDEFGRVIHAESLPGDAALLYVPDAEDRAWAVSGGYSVALHDANARYAVVDEDADPAILVGDAGRVWLAVEGTGEPEPSLDAILAQLADYDACETVLDHDGLTVTLYAQRALLCDPAQASVTDFGQSVALTGADLQVTGDSLSVALTWATDVPGDTYSVGMYIFDDSGEFVAQGLDFALPVGSPRYAFGTVNIRDLEPGTYTITAAVYNWQTGERLPTNEGDSATLGTFDVAG